MYVLGFYRIMFCLSDTLSIMDFPCNRNDDCRWNRQEVTLNLIGVMFIVTPIFIFGDYYV